MLIPSNHDEKRSWANKAIPIVDNAQYWPKSEVHSWYGQPLVQHMLLYYRLENYYVKHASCHNVHVQ